MADEPPEIFGGTALFGAPSWVKGLAGVCGMVLPFALIAAIAAPIGIVIVGAIVGIILAAFRNVRFEPAEITLEPDGLRVQAHARVRQVRRDDVRSAFDDPAARATTLELENGARVELRVDDAHGRGRILDHLGQTLEQRAMVAPLRGQIGAFTRGLLTFLFTLVIGGLLVAAGLVTVLGRHAAVIAPYLPYASVLVAVLMTAFVVRQFEPSVVVGVDGVRILGGVLPRFVPFSDIVAVQARAGADAGGVALQLRSGRVVHLPTVAQSPAEQGALMARIEEGRRAFGKSGATLLSNLERAGRSVKEWRADLVRQLEVGGGFRQASVDPQDLARLVGDPSAPLERRAAAALALREIAPDALPRIRVAAERAADERVRVVLEAVASDEADDERTERALSRAVK